MINYETCPQVFECFNIFAESVKELTKDDHLTLTTIYENGYASSPSWVDQVAIIRKEVQQTLSKAGIKY